MTEKFVQNLFYGSKDAWQSYQQAVSAVQNVLSDHFAFANQPFSGISLCELRSQLSKKTPLPEEGRELTKVIEEVGQDIIQHSVVTHHPACLGHLHCAPLIPSLAAEMMISSTNQSMDSWDQSPSATLLEEQMVDWLVDLFFGQVAGDGVFTSGGTQSNLMGLFLARNHFLKQHYNWNVQQQGLPLEIAPKLRILCSEEAHFTVKQSAALLGLGEQSVVGIPTNEQFQISMDHLDEKIDELQSLEYIPFALFATAGTTDFGSVDPLVELALRAKTHQMWFHVDAAYGGACLLSDRHRAKLNGIELADSITVDFHKMFYQSISCGAFLIRDKDYFESMKLHADYLNPEDDEQYGRVNLVGKSLQTTRRFDALKLYLSLQTIGRKQFAEMIDYTMDLANWTAMIIENDPRLELITKDPTLNTILFRYSSAELGLSLENEVNRAIHHQLLHHGKAVLAKTKVQGRLCLKFTMLNPLITKQDITAILDQVKEMGAVHLRAK